MPQDMRCKSGSVMGDGGMRCACGRAVDQDAWTDYGVQLCDLHLAGHLDGYPSPTVRSLAPARKRSAPAKPGRLTTKPDANPSEEDHAT